jgi:hypothetical protein
MTIEMRDQRTKVVSGARVDILDSATGQVVDGCYGPTSAGACPRAGQNGVVPCNGQRLAPHGAGPETWLIWVPPESQHCASAWNLDAIGY